MDKYELVTKNYVEQVNEAHKDLLEIAGFEFENMEPGKAKELKKELNEKGYRFIRSDVRGKVDTFVSFLFKGEFIAAYRIRLDVESMVIRRTLLETKEQYMNQKAQADSKILIQ